MIREFVSRISGGPWSSLGVCKNKTTFIIILRQQFVFSFGLTFTLMILKQWEIMLCIAGMNQGSCDGQQPSPQSPACVG